MTARYRSAALILGPALLIALTSTCDQPTQPDRPSSPAVEAAPPINVEVAMTLAAIVDDARTRVLPVFQEAHAAAALDGALAQLREGLDARSRPAVSVARARLAHAIGAAADGTDGSTNAADLEVVRLLLEQMDAVLPPATL